jgi:cysteinyl-tRNA synthetase
MAIKFYNSMTRSKEEFVPLIEAEAGLYTCGPTVYNYAHIGNFRTFIFEDLLRRYLRFRGYKVNQVMNFTDVDDKTIRDSQAQGKDLIEFTDFYKQSFLEDIDLLRIERAEVYPAATDHIDEMVELIKQLREKGHTYKDKGSIYFKLSSFEDYGRLANINPDEMRSGVRVDNDEYEKDDARDFALWKAWSEEDGPVYWDTELGRGRPGWHIECSAMSMKYLGSHFDIHTGGVDNRFPHHENEIAQSVCATGAKFVNYWMHSEFLLVENKKMSKSRGNFYTLRDLTEKGFDPAAIRYTLLSVHYRAQLNLSFAGIDASAQAIRRLRDFYNRLETVNVEGETSDLTPLLATCESEFTAFMDDDLNISGAMGVIFSFIRELNGLLDQNKVNRTGAQQVRSWIERVDSLLDILCEDCDQGVEEQVKRLAEARVAAKANKDWGKADTIRAEIDALGYVIKDTPQGPVWHKK